MASARREHVRDERWWQNPPPRRHPVAVAAALALILCGLLYSCSGDVAAQKWDLYHWIWPAPVPPPVAPLPPAVIVPHGPIVVPPTAPIEPPSIFTPVPPPVIVAPPPVTQPPPAPRPTFKEKSKRAPAVVKPPKPKQPKQQPEVETNEYLPPCSLVCWYAQGKTRAQLEAEARSRNPTARMRRHALACLAGCGK